MPDTCLCRLRHLLLCTAPGWGQSVLPEDYAAPDLDFIDSVSNDDAREFQCEVSSCTYGELAKTRVAPAFKQLSEEMVPLVSDPASIIVNSKKVKTLRKVRG